MRLTRGGAYGLAARGGSQPPTVCTLRVNPDRRRQSLAPPVPVKAGLLFPAATRRTATFFADRERRRTARAHRGTPAALFANRERGGALGRGLAGAEGNKAHGAGGNGTGSKAEQAPTGRFGDFRLFSRLLSGANNARKRMTHDVLPGFASLGATAMAS